MNTVNLPSCIMVNIFCLQIRFLAVINKMVAWRNQEQQKTQQYLFTHINRLLVICGDSS